MADFWRDKHVVITGASSGIGEALAREAVAQRAKVSMLARRQDRLTAIAEQLQNAAGSITSRATDVTNRGQLAEAITDLEREFGPVDVLIANAGVYRKTDGAAFDAERAASVFQTNVIGVSNALGAVLPGMVARRRGHVCAVSSLGGLLSLPAGGAYCASKAAVATLMKSIRVDVEPHGVRVTTVYPGFVDTPMITDHERRTLRGIWTAERTARRILAAIAHGKREDAFPLALWLEIKLASYLPWWLYRRVMRTVPPMEDT